MLKIIEASDARTKKLVMAIGIAVAKFGVTLASATSGIANNVCNSAYKKYFAD